MSCRSRGKLARNVAPFVALVLLAGCFGTGDGPAADGPEPSPGAPSDARTIVHGAGGLVLPVGAFPGELPVLQQRYVGVTTAGEPTIGVTAAGTAFFGSWTPAHSYVYRSRDEGRTWLPVTSPLSGAPESPLLSGDPFMWVDQGTGRVFKIDVALAFQCGKLDWSDDEGTTWQSSTIDTCIGNRRLHDHQSLATGPPKGEPTTGYPNVVHYCLGAAEGSGSCFRSLDGGQTWKDPVENGLRFCEGIDGQGTSGQVIVGPDGTAYIGQTSCTSEGPNADQAWVTISRDGGRTWEPRLVADGTIELTDDHEASIAVDDAGVVYYALADKQRHILLFVSKDSGRTWSGPMDVTRPGVTGAFLPSVVAAAPGRVAILYVGTESEGGMQEASSNTLWNAYVAVSLNGADADPVFATTYAHEPDDPVNRGACVGRCIGSPNEPTGAMWDFLDITAHPVTGELWVSLVDSCNDLCKVAPSGDEDRDLGRGAVGIQTAGATLR